MLHVHVCSRRERVFAYAICIHACTISFFPFIRSLLPAPCAPSGSLRVYVATSLARLVNSSGHHACSRVSHDDAGSILLKSSRFDSFRRARFQCFLIVTSAGKRDSTTLTLRCYKIFHCTKCLNVSYVLNVLQIDCDFNFNCSLQTDTN